MKIKAAVQTPATRDMVIREADLAEPRDDEVLVKIAACGVCHTDLWARQNMGRGPMILGHEVSGIIQKTGKAVRHLEAGDHVVLAYTYCGVCDSCKDDRTYECDHFSDNFNGWREDGTSPLSIAGQPLAPLMRLGGFAAYTVCHKNGVTKVDAGLDLRILGPLGCGIMTGAGSVFNYLKPEPGKPIAVFGTGCVGLSALMAAKIADCNPIIAVDRIQSRLEMAEELGATHGISGGKKDIAGIIKKICGGLDYAFDTSGNALLLEGMRKVLNPGAAACGVGIGGSLVLNAAERRQGKSWETTNAGFSVPQKFIPQLIKWYQKGKFPFDTMIRFFPFDDINEAFAAARTGEVIKPVVILE
jgi:aryl-alcohol dehydrogenase